MGDGGAYFIGSSLGALCIALVQRSSEVSAWFAVLLLIYPLTEVGFSIWRRKFVKGRSIGLPDAAHLHHLIYRRMVRATIGRTPAESKMIRNAFSAPYLWTMTAMSVFPAVALYKHSAMLAGCAIAFVIGYVWLYLRIIRLRVPHFLIRRFIKVV
jgi:UDP-N-acetylmuramyl pentapeptide phosphotransferase/UDP-N-acetylglucosamine-1-phosphate transferase